MDDWREADGRFSLTFSGGRITMKAEMRRLSDMNWPAASDGVEGKVRK